MTERPLTSFEQVLSGFAARGPTSAYDLTKLFASSPASVYRPSAGALLPALRRLVRLSYLQVTEVARPRRRRLYIATRAGHAAHLAWLRTPLAPESVGRDLGIHRMRFDMMESALDTSEILAFLSGLCDALERFVTSIEAYAALTSFPGRHPALALEHGVAIHRASLDWVRATIARLST